MRPPLRPLRAVAAALLAVAAFAAAGCFNPFDPLVSSGRVQSEPAPVPDSPENVVKLFKWCWQYRDPSKYEEVFTNDYRFIFATNDSAGNPFRDRPWLRDDEIEAARHLFSGGTDRPPASEIQIDLGSTLLALPDPRPGRDPRWHKSVRAQVSLKVTIDQNGTPDVNTISGAALFYLVRGDSATVPKGFVQDSLRWWIERWEDETAGSSGSPYRALRPAALAPAHAITFGQLKLKALAI